VDRRLSDREVEELAKRGQESLDEIRGIMAGGALRRAVDLELPRYKYSARSGLGQLLADPFLQEAYGPGSRIFFRVISDEEALALAAARPRLLRFLQARSRDRFEAAVRAVDPAELRQHARFFERLAKAIYSSRGQPSRLHPRRVAEMVAERLILNRELQRDYFRAEATPLPRFLPVLDGADAELMTVADRGWPRAAALAWVAAVLGESVHQVEHLSRPGRLRKPRAKLTRRKTQTRPRRK